MKSSEWYKIGDIVRIDDVSHMEDDSDLDRDFRAWIADINESEMVIWRIDKENWKIENGIQCFKPLYYTYLKESQENTSPEGFYHSELKLLRSKQTEWDE